MVLLQIFGVLDINTPCQESKTGQLIKREILRKCCSSLDSGCGVSETMLQTIYARAKESRGRGAKLLPENGQISQIAMSAMDNWGDEIKEQTEQDI